MAVPNKPEVEIAPISALIPYELNNKIHGEAEVDRIANSIAEFGWTQPILIDEQSIILAGHKRLAAAKKLGLEAVPVIRRAGLTEAQKKAYRIIDNKSSQESPWDLPNLELELRTLEEMGFEVEPFILNDFEFEAVEPTTAEDDFEPPVEVETDIQRGDLFELGEHRLLCGDSTSAEDAKLLMGGGIPALLVTDPPYGVNYDPRWREQYDGNLGTRACGKVSNDDRVDWTETFKLLGAPVAYVWHAGVFAESVARQLADAGYLIVSQIIWNKPIFVFGRGDYHWKHEPCWYAVRKGNTHNWQGDRKQSTVWDIANNRSYSKEKEERTGHGTQKPIECMARPIRNNSKAGDLIIDPFLGSGTTLIAAEQLNRRCYGVELEPKYCQVIVDRYRKYCANNGLEREVRQNGKPLANRAP